MRNYDQQFRGLYFLPNGACLMLLNEEVIEQVMKNSIIINFDQISNLANTNPKDPYSVYKANSNTQNSNSSNNKYQSQKNSQDQVSNSKIGKINKSSFSNNLNNIVNNQISNNNFINLNKSSTLLTNSFINNHNISTNSANQELNRSVALGQSHTLNHIDYIKSNSKLINNVNTNKIGSNSANYNLDEFNSNDNYANNSNLFDYSENNKNKNSLKNSANDNSSPNSNIFDAGKKNDKFGKNGNPKDFMDPIINDILINEEKILETFENEKFNDKLSTIKNNKMQNKASAFECFPKFNSAKLNRSEIIDEVNTSLEKNYIKIDAKEEIYKIYDSKEKAIYISEIFESQNYLESGNFKKLFEIYNLLTNKFTLELKDLVDLFKKFSLISPKLNSNDNFNFNNIYPNHKEFGNKSDNLLSECNKRSNGNIISTSLSVKSTLLLEKNNNYNNNKVINITNSNSNSSGQLNMEYLPLGFDLLKYFNDKETSDLKIIVGDYTFYVHKVNLFIFIWLKY
jgi:hypothetical protein